MSRVLIPYGYKEEDLPLEIIESFYYDGRELVLTTYGHMIGVFDFKTGGKIFAYEAFSEQRFEQSFINAKETAKAIIDNNPDWSLILDQLPTLNRES